MYKNHLKKITPTLVIWDAYQSVVYVQINSFDISPASMQGDHYASIMFRCKVNYIVDSSAEDKQKSLIIKTLPDVGTKSDLFKESTAFQTEIKMYVRTLPKIENILRDCGEPTRMAAK